MARKLRRVRITVDEPVRLPDGILHTGTTYWLSRTIDFENALIHIDNDEVNLRERYFDVELDDDEPLYVKTQYVYNGGLLADPIGSVSNESRISALRGDQTGLHISDAIVNTPKLDLIVDYSNDANGELVLKGSEFKMFTSVGEHIETSWLIKDIHGKTIYTRERDSENLVSLKLPTTISKNMNFIAEVIYHSDTNAISNAGKYYNLVENKKSTLFSIEKVGRLLVSRPLYFKVNIKTVKFKTFDIVVKNMNGVVIQEHNNLTNLSPVIDTTGLNIGEVYTFEFRLDLGNEYSDIVKISDIASDRMIQYDPNKTYLDVYDYKHLLFTQGKTSQLSYQLYNNTILLTRNGDKTLSFYKYVNESLVRIGDILDLPVTQNIDLPNIYTQELYNGDVAVSYVSRDDDNYGVIFIAVYGFNPVTNKFTLKHNRSLLTEIGIVTPGSITTTWDNKIHFVTYDVDYNPKLNTLNIYTNELFTYDIPVTAKANVSLVRTMTDDILIVGGTNTYDTQGNTVYGVRDNDKVFIFNTKLKVFNEIGTDLLTGIDTDLHSFHSVLRHDGKVILFNTLNNGNYTAIDNQSVILIDIDNQTAELKTNDHIDDLPYLCTVVLNNGDILRFSSLSKDPQKVYSYISNTMDGGRVDDNNNVVRNTNELIVHTDENVTEDYLKQYDIVRVEGDGILKLVKDGETMIFDSSYLILTRDTVMYRDEYEAGNWSNVVLLDANLVIKDIDEAFI